jgi:hypothetical protein
VRLDKWYADTLLDDGSILLIYLGSIVAGPWCLSRLSADLFMPDGTRRSGAARARRPRWCEAGVDLGRGGLDGHRLWWETEGLSGSLTFAPRSGPFELHCPFVTRGRRSLHWAVEIPDADVQGELHWPGGSQTVAGRGYRDRVWCDIPLWRLPIRELRWGRAVAGDHAAVWVSARGPTAEVAEAWADGRPEKAESIPPLTGPGRVFLEGPVIDLEGLRLGPFKGLAGRLFRAPHQVKSVSDVVIGGVPGRALHEVVTWPG